MTRMEMMRGNAVELANPLILYLGQGNRAALPNNDKDEDDEGGRG
jgi:hypothetical protein